MGWEWRGVERGMDEKKGRGEGREGGRWGVE